MSKNTNLSFLTDFLTADIVNSRVGMNNVSPQATFDVTGTGKFSGVLTLGSTVSNGTYTYTLPSATGTLALTSQIPSVTGYVPYTGATTSVDLGDNVLTSGGLNIDSLGSFGGALNLRQATSFSLWSGAPYTSIYATPGNNLIINFSNDNRTITLNGSLVSAASPRTFTFPDATGTLALTSQIPTNAVGGTGTLNTIPKFTAASTIGNSNIFDSGSIIYNTNPAAGTFAWQFGGSTVTGQSYGAQVLAGTNSSDTAFRVLNASASSTYLLVRGDGNVGIGTTLPSAGLEIETDGSAKTALRVTSNQAFNASPVTAIMFRYRISSGTTIGGAVINAAKDNATENNQAGNLQFWTNNGSTLAERMQISSGGNLGLGVTPNIWFSDRRAFQIQSGGSINGSISTPSFVELGANFFHGSLGDTYISTTQATKYRQLSGAHEWYNAPSGTAGNAISFTQAMTLDASGRLGIGISTFPNQSGGSLAGTGIFNGIVRISGVSSRYFTSGNGLELAVSSIYSYNRDTSTYNDLTINDTITVKGAGNVGIGTASPSSILNIVDTSANDTTLTIGVAGEVPVIKAGGANTDLQIEAVGSGGYLNFVTNSNPRIRIMAGGNVLIGTTTDNGYKLQVNGNISISGNNYLDFGNGDARIVNTSGQLSFQTYTIGSFATRMTITGPGNVGIGTSSINASSGYKMLRINGATTGGEIVLAGAEVEYAYMYANAGNFVIDALASQPMRFRTGAQNRMEISSAGAITMSVPTSGQTLTISGKNNNWTQEIVGSTTTGQSYGLLITAGTNSSDYPIYAQNQSGSNFLFRVRGDGYFQASGVYNFTSSGGTAVYVSSDGGVYRFTSSLRYKREINDYTKGLSEVLQIKPKSFKSINSKEGEKIFAGLIAEQIDEIGLTEFVEYNDKGQPDAVHYSAMTALLIKAIQQQQQQIQELKNKLS